MLGKTDTEAEAIFEREHADFHAIITCAEKEINFTMGVPCAGLRTRKSRMKSRN